MMALLLIIDTATSYGAVALSDNGQVVCAAENFNQKDHASFLHTAVEQVITNSGKALSEIDGIVVTMGPGSYTGLRVGLSAAKGLGYALQVPLVGVNTLQAIALAATESLELQTEKKVLIAPMIDARRMEVFTALYNIDNSLFIPAAAKVIDESFLLIERNEYFIVFAGDGSKKVPPELINQDSSISTSTHTVKQVAAIGKIHFENKTFEDIAYCEPFYLKPFFSTAFVKN